MKAEFNKVKIKAIATVVPPQIKKIDDEIDLYGGNVKQIERIKKVIGLDQRHVVDEKTTSLDLCEDAAKKVIKDLDLSPEDIDAVVFVTQTPDYFQPANACILHSRLGLKEDCAAYDVNLGCSGYVYGLFNAFSMIEVKAAKRVLLLAGDTISKQVNKKDRSTAMLFGDAGSATILEYDENAEKTYFSLNTKGDGYNHIMVPAGGSRTPISEETKIETVDNDGNVKTAENIQMNGGEVFNFSIMTEPKAITEILDYSAVEKDDIDYIVFHQANKYIISNIVRRLKFDLDKTPCKTVEKYGNQSSASIPATICDALAEEVSSNNKKLILSGFGVGLSYASCILTLDNIKCSNITIYKN